VIAKTTLAGHALRPSLGPPERTQIRCVGAQMSLGIVVDSERVLRTYLRDVVDDTCVARDQMMPGARRQRRVIAFGPDQPETDRVLVAFGRNLRTLRAASGLSQERLAVGCFMRPDHVSALERVRIPDLFALLALADRLDVPVRRLVDGLDASVRRVGTAQVIALIGQEPGISTDGLAGSLGFPFWYASEIARYLQATGAIAPTRTGWVSADKQRLDGATETSPAGREPA
jgi:transcriptional regulator with XRE-family HTH domain